MMVIDETPVDDQRLPVLALRRHLRLGSGFGEDDVQDHVLGAFLRAALAAIEGRTAKAILQRSFRIFLSAWPDPALRFSLAPVVSVDSVQIGETALDPAQFRLIADTTEPQLRFILPPPLRDGSLAEVNFTAGFGARFEDVPPDLAQAVLLLAAHYYEYRDETALAEGCMPFGVTSLIARYRKLSLGRPT